MLKENERWIFFNETYLEPSPKDADYTKMSTIIDLLHQKYKDDECVKLFNKETAAIRITDFEIDKKNEIAFLLIQYSDKTISDPVFSNLKTGDLRTEPKLTGEGIAVSAHLAISLKENKTKNTYITILENVPGLGKGRLDAFFASEFRKICKDNSQFKYINLKKRKVGYRPIPKTDGFISQSLKDDLDNGYLSHISLIKHINSISDFDEPGYTKEKSRTVEIKLREKFKGSNASTVINMMKKRALTKGYHNMKVQFKNEKTRTIDVDTRVQDAFDVLYTKQEILKLQNPLDQCMDSMDTEMKMQMTKNMKIARLEKELISLENEFKKTKNKAKKKLLKIDINKIEKDINALKNT